jgi:prophage DNA circulation protein
VRAGSATPVWTWTADRTVGFWVRRFAHDVLVHRFDAESAAVGTVSDRFDVAIDLAADGVSDVLSTVETLSRADGYESVFLGLRGNGETLSFHATDDALGDVGEWRATRTAGGVTWEHAYGQFDVAVRGRAANLLLVLNRRWSPTRVEVLGDAALFEHWLENSKF